MKKNEEFSHRGHRGHGGREDGGVRLFVTLCTSWFKNKGAKRDVCWQRLRTITFAICYLLFVICSCELFYGENEPDLWDKFDEEIAYANAPWVPVFIQTGGMGIADPTGPQSQIVKKGYSFSMYYQPSREYPFAGWQAWVEGEGIWAEWTQESVTGAQRVTFVPLND